MTGFFLFNKLLILVKDSGEKLLRLPRCGTSIS